MDKTAKPFLRGHFHQAGFFIALGACTLLVIQSWGTELYFSIVLYSLSLVSLLGISALYHRVNWKTENRMIMRRLDHAAIYFLIAGSMTPISLSVLSEASSDKLLKTTWIVAGCGILLSTLFTRKPKWLNALFFLAAAFVMTPYFAELRDGLGDYRFDLIVLGGVVYVFGALSYALKRPKLFPEIFGYHEVFHILVLIGAGLHFAVIYSLL